MQFVYMNLHVNVEDGMLELVDTDNFSILVGGHVNAPSFKIKGRHLGITTLYVRLLSNSTILAFTSIKFIYRLLDS